MKTQPNTHKRGFVALWGGLAAAVMFALVALAVDYGRVELVRTELQGAADAAACAALVKLPSVSAAQTAASQTAGNNFANATTLFLNIDDAHDAASDVQFLRWVDRTNFTVLTGANRSMANAVRVFARLKKSRNNAVDVVFGRVIGMSSMDLEREAIAVYGDELYAVIGLDYIKMGGNTTTSYWSGFGDVGSFGNIASNGPITLSGASYINGSAYAGVGSSVNDPSKVSGPSRTLPQPLAFPDLPATLPSNHATVNDNANLSLYNASRSGPQNCPSMNFNNNETYTYPGGLYYVNNFTVAAGATVAFTGPTTIVCCGTFTMSGNAGTASNRPDNLTLITAARNGTPPGGVTIGSSSAFYGTVYAPLSPVKLSGTGDIYGSLLGKSIDMTGSSGIHYDMALSNKGFRTRLVR